MAEGTDNVEDRISCNHSSYGERIWRFTIVAMVLIVEARTRNTAVVIQMRWERSLTRLYLPEPIGQLCDSASCSYYSAQNGVYVNQSERSHTLSTKKSTTGSY